MFKGRYAPLIKKVVGMLFCMFWFLESPCQSTSVCEKVEFGDDGVRTEVSWQYRDNFLIFDIRAEGWQAGQPAASSGEGNEWGDAISVVLDINNDGESFMVLLLDDAGAVHGLYTNILDWQRFWETRAQVDVSIKDGVLKSRIWLPMTDFDCKAGAGDIWRLGFGRRSLKNGKSSYVFSSTEQFRLSFGPAANRLGWTKLPVPDREHRFASETGPVNIVFHNLGACDPWYPEENVAVFALYNPGSESLSLTLEIGDDRGRRLNSVVRDVPGGQTTGIIADYQPDRDAKKVFFTLRHGNQVIYHSAYPVLDRLPSRVFTTAGVFEPERLQHFQPAIEYYRGMTWSQMEHPGRSAAYARSFGYPWETGQLFALCREERLMPRLLLDRQHSNYNDLAAQADNLRGHETMVLAEAQGWEDRTSYWQNMGVFGGYLADAVQYEAIFDSLRRGLKNHGSQILAVSPGDEVYKMLRRRTVRLYEYHCKTGGYPFIEKVDREIREKFGYGRYGIPDSNDTSVATRLRWIALKRWVNDFVNRYELKFVKDIRRINPRVTIFSSDLAGDMVSTDLTRWRDNRFDIHQLQVSQHLRPNALNGVVNLKIVHDLARPRNLWVCTHLEDSHVSYTTREMQDLYTLFFRHGMTGMHTWTVGGLRLWMNDCRFSRPEAWRYFVRTTNLIGQGLRVKLPETPSVAIFLSELSQMSIPADYDWVGYVEPAFAVIGMDLKAETVFISEMGIERRVFNPSQYRLIVVPFMPFVSTGSAEALLRAAEQGTTLFVTDPEAFSFLTDGSVPTKLRKRFWGGITVHRTAEQMTEAKTLPVDFMEFLPELKLRVPEPTFLNLLGQTFYFVPDDRTQVLMRYSDGSAAMVSRPLGRGRIIIAGFNVYSLTSNHPVSWESVPHANREFFRTLLNRHQAVYACETQQVRLPDPETEGALDRLCITENFVRFSRTLPKTDYNLRVGLRYKFQPFPDMKKDVAEMGWIAAGKGLLTDRLEVLRDIKRQTTVAWSLPGPAEVLIDLNGERRIAIASIFVAQQEPDVTLFGSRDGENYFPLQKHHGTNGRPVVVSRIDFAEVPDTWRFLKLRIEAEKPLELVEMEIWE